MLKGKFTKRQRQVIEALVDTGATNREIAKELGISPNTLKNDLFHIYQEAGVETRIQLVLLYYKEAIDAYNASLVSSACKIARTA